MNITIGALSDIGGRSNNEDCFEVLDKESVPVKADAVLIIADGMGGRANGEEASTLAVQVIRETLVELLDPQAAADTPPAEDALAAAMRRANAQVYELAKDSPKATGMGTTCICGMITNGALVTAHVGDSRAYLVRDHSIRPLTSDHTYVADQVRAGNMTDQAAKKSRFRNVITRAIGIAPTVQPDFEVLPLQVDDIVILCTDGLTNVIDDEEILELAQRDEEAQVLATTFVEAAKAAGSRDNITVIIIQVASDTPVKGRRLRATAHDVRDERRRNGNGSRPASEAKSRSDDKPVQKAEKNTEEGGNDSSGFGAVLACIAALLVGIGATLGILIGLGLLHLESSPPYLTTPKPAQDGGVPGPALDFRTVQYGAPVEIFYKPLQPNLLIDNGQNLIVLNATTGVPMRLTKAGVNLGSIALHPSRAPVSGSGPYYASDPQGNVEISSPGARSVVQFRADGTYLRSLATKLTAPGALAVDVSGDIYLIDDGHLYKIPAMPVAPGSK